MLTTKHIQIQISLWICMLLYTGVQAQDSITVCKQVEFTDLERAIVSQYISSCVKDHWFVNDKGIVKIMKFVNKQGQRCWYLSVLIDDRYKDNPPREYAYLEMDVALIYEGNSNFNLVKTFPSKGLITCLEEVVEGRVYIRPPNQERNGQLFGKKTKILSPTRTCLGNCSNDLIIIFHEDGTYEKQLVF